MAAVGGASAPAGGGGGAPCFKCGKRGHWSRDCTASKEAQVEHKAAKEAAEAAAAAIAAAKEATATVRRKRKVTLDDLKAPNGLPEVFATFPSRMRKLFKGPGHEGHDLARLVELYQAWGRRLAPGAPFPALVDNLEALGRTAALKLELRDLRYRALQPLEEIGKEDEGGAAAWLGGMGSAPPPPGPAPAAPAPAPPAFFDDDEDGDELLQLQAEGFDDDIAAADEALGLGGCDGGGGGGAAAAGAAEAAVAEGAAPAREEGVAPTQPDDAQVPAPDLPPSEGDDLLDLVATQQQQE